jgi:hypothetical protein
MTGGGALRDGRSPASALAETKLAIATVVSRLSFIVPPWDV